VNVTVLSAAADVVEVARSKTGRDKREPQRLLGPFSVKCNLRHTRRRTYRQLCDICRGSFVTVDLYM
jgi:hypothetical protein